MSKLWLGLATIVLTGGVLSVSYRQASAQAVGAAELKAAFLFNFTKFSDWPDLPAGSPLTICVLGDQAVTRTLTGLVRGQRVDDRQLDVVKIRADDSVDHCHVLFVAALETTTASLLLDTASKLPILTVSDREGFATATGLIELFVEGDRMRFAVNVAAVQRSKVRVSSRLLQMAKIVGDKSAP